MSKIEQQINDIKAATVPEKKITKKQEKRITLVQIGLILVAFSVALLTFLAKQHAFFPFDLYITENVQLLQNPFLINTLLVVSWLGNIYPGLISLAIFIGGFVVFKRPDFAAGLFLSTVGVGIISETLKMFVGRPRPDISLVTQIEKFTRNDSFPSGHVLFYMGFYGFLLFSAFTLIKNKTVRGFVSALLILMIALVGPSRIYKGSHWFSDTLAAYLIGILWLYIVISLFKKFELQFKNNGSKSS